MKKLLTIFIVILTIIFTNGCQQESNSNISIEENEHPIENKDANREFPQEHTEVDGILKVHYMNVGQGDSTFIHYSNHGENYAMLIDAGDFTGNEVVPYLKNLGIEKIHIAIGTHPDADHIGQLDDVLHAFPVEEVWLSGNMSSSNTFISVLQAIDEKNIHYIEPRAGEIYELGPLTINVLHPKEITGKANDESISIKITFGEISFIFTGDGSKESELQMLRSGYDVQGDILHLGHHGSNTSTDESFLKAVNPKVAIYSAGKNNPYGHPSKEVVQLINQYNIPLYGTDVYGNILVTTDGNNFLLVTEKNGLEKFDKNEALIAKNNKGCVNINTAPQEEIEKIIHIGPERAEEVIRLRPFDSIEDLKRINGLGPARLKDIIEEGLACVGG